MRIADREEKSTENTGSVIEELVKSYKTLFDKVIIVDIMSNQIVKIQNTKIIRTDLKCSTVCSLLNDKCGCICKDSISTREKKTRFSISDRESSLVMTLPVRIRHLDLVIVCIKKLDTNFSFGQQSMIESIDKIINTSSNLVLDELTRIYNRKYLYDNIDYQIKESIAKGKRLSIACIDIDNFKKFNDKYGHDFGDKVLKLVADSMSEVVHSLKEAYPVRVGGDEFIIVALGISKSRFQVVMTRLCQIVDSEKLKYNNEKVGVRISIGTAEVLEDMVDNYKDLYSKADSALYKAKDAGKGCVR